MKFRSRCMIIILILCALGAFLQFTRLNGYLADIKNEDIKSFSQESEVANKSNYNNLVIYSDRYYTYEKEKNNITKTFDYMQKNYEVILAEDFINKDLSSYSTIYLMIEDLSEIDGKEKIEKYVSQGGVTFFINNLSDAKNMNSISNFIGAKNIGSDLIKRKSLKFLENVMIKSQGEIIKNDNRIENLIYDVSLKEDTKKYITSEDDKPILWSNSYGSGKVFFFNGSMFQEKSSRGLLSGVISLNYETDLYPVINTKINFIDDFPSPSPEGENEMLMNEYGLSIRDFYKKVWWPDMIRIRTLNNIKYTGVFMGSYKDDVLDISEDNIDINKEEFVYYARELLYQEGELGLHGYNHQPLKLTPYINDSEGYTVWKNKSDMDKAINVANDYVRDSLKNYNLNVYVPPSNIVTEDGIASIKNNSSIRVICSLYDEDSNWDGTSLELSIRDDGMINMPRITSGYFFEDHTKWDILNEINLYGYVSHFIHPDDILDTNRNENKTWEEMSKGYSDIQNYISSAFPWLEASTATEGANKLLGYMQTVFSYEETEESIDINCQNYNAPIDLILKTNKKLSESKNCSYIKIDTNTYLVTVNAAASKINASKGGE